MKGSTIGRACGVVVVMACFVCTVQADPGRERSSTAPGTVSEATSIDEALHAQVRDGWYKLSIIPSAEEVVLEGQVDNERTREEVLSVARSVSHKPVRDQMRLKPAVADTEIQASIKRALEREYPAFSKSIDVSVQGGVARLKGNLHNHREIDEVLATSMMQEGVRAVESDITINGRPYTTSRRVTKR